MLNLFVSFFYFFIFYLLLLTAVAPKTLNKNLEFVIKGGLLREVKTHGREIRFEVTDPSDWNVSVLVCIFLITVLYLFLFLESRT